MESIKEFPRGIRPLAQSSRRTAAGVRQVTQQVVYQVMLTSQSQASSCKRQASSYKQQASSNKLQATSFKR
jgi:hypothetical protein